jgi:hypothetical protein
MIRRNEQSKTGAAALRTLTRAERRRLSDRLKDLSLPAGVHQRYRVIEEIRLGRSVVEAAERIGCDPQQARSWIEHFNKSGFQEFEPAFPAGARFLMPPATE